MGIGIAGLGTVGGGVFKLLDRQAELLAARCGRALEVRAVSAREKERDRGYDLSGVRWHDDPVALADDPDVEIVIELIGGEEGAARHLCEAALGAGKHVVTANKALIARHGNELAGLAEERGAALAFEAAVAGGIPIVKALREGLAANPIRRVYGILNGTCNYILTAMDEAAAAGQEAQFDEVLAEAQRLGYAEADPSFDIDGVDAAHKLSILTGLAFGCRVDFDAVHVEGIRAISGLDVQFAAELGYRIKLLGIARAAADGIEQRVHPSMVPLTSPIAQVNGVFNAVVADGDYVDTAFFQGRGAGEGPTASSVVADIVDIARGIRLPAFSLPAARLASLPTVPIEAREGAYYIRLMVVDQPGVIADISAALCDQNVSVESMIQRARAPGEPVPVVMTTHDSVEASVGRAVAQIEALDSVVEPAHLIRIEEL
jgi:homoserine dehydrogenase